MNPVYADHNATTATDPAVVAAMLPFFTGSYANPSSGHHMGAAAASALRRARKQLQSLLGAAREEEVVFTSGGSEADATALWQAVARPEMNRTGRDEIIVSAVEHPAILTGAQRLARQFGLKLHCIGVDRRGRLDRLAYAGALSTRTALVSVMWANNETGNIYPIAELAEEAHRVGALFHTDAVQAAGKIPLQIKDTAVDMLSLSGHKFHGPKGVGVLYVRHPLRLIPLISGGRQERGRRAGTENLPAIVGLGVAAELVVARMAEDTRNLLKLRNSFEAAVKATIPDCQVLGDPDNRLANTSLLAFARADGEVILHGLDANGIAASAGSACASGMVEPSHVIRAMGVPLDKASGVVRFSFGRDNTPQEMQRILTALPPIVAHAREVGIFSNMDDAKNTISPLAAAG